MAEYVTVAELRAHLRGFQTLAERVAAHGAEIEALGKRVDGILVEVRELRAQVDAAISHDAAIAPGDDRRAYVALDDAASTLLAMIQAAIEGFEMARERHR